jgi:hypothetical protein
MSRSAALSRAPGKRESVHCSRSLRAMRRRRTMARHQGSSASAGGFVEPFVRYCEVVPAGAVYFMSHNHRHPDSCLVQRWEDADNHGRRHECAGADRQQRNGLGQAVGLCMANSLAFPGFRSLVTIVPRATWPSCFSTSWRVSPGSPVRAAPRARARGIPSGNACQRAGGHWQAHRSILSAVGRRRPRLRQSNRPASTFILPSARLCGMSDAVSNDPRS